MYTREQASKIRQSFWTTFGQYIAPHPSAEGLKINWINYNTKVKHIYFRMQADQKFASISIEITHPDLGIQELFFEQFHELKSILQGYLGEEWEWLLHTKDESGKTISKIFKELSPINVFDEENWAKLISFFKPRIIALDQFWSDAKYSFDTLK